MKKKKYTTLEYLLLALVPYTDPNLKLTYSPNKFFNDLEKIAGVNSSTLRMSMHRAEKAGYVIKNNNMPVLTVTGAQKVAKFQAKRISQKGQLMIIFDIPEEYQGRRQKFRNYLKQLEFYQVQKSVWVSQYDYRDEVLQAIADLRIGRYVQFYECAKLYP